MGVLRAGAEDWAGSVCAGPDLQLAWEDDLRGSRAVQIDLGKWFALVKGRSPSLASSVLCL